MKVNIVNKSKHPLPKYLTKASAGMDLYANLEKSIEIKPFQRVMIPTGLFIELPVGYEAQIRPRSGLAMKIGVTILNSPGTIDADYRGEIKIILINLSDKIAKIDNGDRIAQMIVAKHEQVNWEEVIVLKESSRGEGGFGHTGV